MGHERKTAARPLKTLDLTFFAHHTGANEGRSNLLSGVPVTRIADLRQHLRSSGTQGPITAQAVDDVVQRLDDDGVVRGRGREQLLKLRHEFHDQFTAAALSSLDAALGLPASDLRSSVDGALTQAHQEVRMAVDDATSVVQGLQQEVAQLDAQNKQKQADIQALVTRIEQRKKTLQNTRNRQRNVGLLAAFFGVPAVAAVSLVQMYDTDATLTSLQGKLDGAKRDQARLQTRSAQVKQRKQTMQAKLDTLTTLQSTLEAKWQAAQSSSTTPGAGVPAHVAHVLRGDADALGLGRALVDNLQQQAAVWTTLRDDAAGLGVDLDTTLRQVTDLATQAELWVQQAEARLLDTVEMLVSPDPTQAATSWLNAKRAKMTKGLLQQLHVSVDDYAKRMAQKAAPNDDALQKALFDWLSGTLKGRDMGRVPQLPVPSAVRDLQATTPDVTALMHWLSRQ